MSSEKQRIYIRYVETKHTNIKEFLRNLNIKLTDNRELLQKSGAAYADKEWVLTIEVYNDIPENIIIEIARTILVEPKIVFTEKPTDGFDIVFHKLNREEFETIHAAIETLDLLIESAVTLKLVDEGFNQDV